MAVSYCKNSRAKSTSIKILKTSINIEDSLKQIYSDLEDKPPKPPKGWIKALDIAIEFDKSPKGIRERLATYARRGLIERKMFIDPDSTGSQAYFYNYKQIKQVFTKVDKVSRGWYTYQELAEKFDIHIVTVKNILMPIFKKGLIQRKAFRIRCGNSLMKVIHYKLSEVKKYLS